MSETAEYFLVTCYSWGDTINFFLCFALQLVLYQMIAFWLVLCRKKYSWPLNNTGLSCVGPNVNWFFFSIYTYVTTLSGGWLNLCMWNGKCRKLTIRLKYFKYFHLWQLGGGIREQILLALSRDGCIWNPSELGIKMPMCYSVVSLSMKAT